MRLLNRWKSLSKHQKTNTSVFVALLIALPLLLYITYLQQETRSHASESVAASREFFGEDNQPTDVVPYTYIQPDWS